MTTKNNFDKQKAATYSNRVFQTWSQLFYRKRVCFWNEHNTLKMKTNTSLIW